MNKKILWIASLILLVFILALQVVFHPASAPGIEINRSYMVVLDAFGTILTYFIFASVPAFVLSFAPYKGWTFGQKFKALLPILTFLVFFVFALMLGYMEYQSQVNGVKFGPTRLN
ncbi:hypothetical protein LZD49_31335 [Dyadobacter sp. CY261]|uniref:hypothetical protein n=1 Tax=Dyadobacter sp. CY261 TaxID=2907203 RepID=UPI001F362D01|nr:hypothetical protein [Dyadobacter sp. CY261]MCF0075020.1 hypothetical protein [Dyadobacter sp. CY261]